jgi:hypothetical protein
VVMIEFLLRWPLVITGGLALFLAIMVATR